MTSFLNEPYKDLSEVAKAHQAEYANPDPFPNISFKNFFDPEMLDRVLNEFPDLEKEDAVKYDKAKEKKLAGKGEKSFGPETRRLMHYLNSEPFLQFLQQLTGIDEKLLGDPYFSGGGLHEIKRGGLLKVHADFNKHPYTKLDRRINVLVYLNKEWKEEYGGHFELWDEGMENCVKKILPEYNTLAIFSTTDTSYHGHPNPLDCPEGRSRKSLALYYYSNGRPQEEINPELGKHSTLFKARAGNKEDAAAFAVSDEKKNGVSLVDKTKVVIKEFIPPILLRVLKR